jgi:hypothetical protein
VTLERNDKSGTLVRWKYQGHYTLGWVSWVNFPSFGDRITLTAREQKDSDVPAGTYEVLWQEIEQPETSTVPVFELGLLKRAGTRKR